MGRSTTLEEAADQLQRGGVVAAATESTFGLLARIDRPLALDRLFELKPREAGRGVPLIAPDADGWRKLVAPPPQWAVALSAAFWPGPLTIAWRARARIDERLCVDGTLAVRVPGACPAASLARAVGAALTATSCNWPGVEPAVTAPAVCSALRLAETPPWLSAFGDRAPGGPPSTIVVPDGSGARVAREGATCARAVRRSIETAHGD